MPADAIPAIDTESLHAAKFAHEFARSHCRQYTDNQRCSWYHGSWQFLRLLDLVSTPAAHASHFDAQLKKIDGDSSMKNILVSGSADAAMVKTIHETLVHRQAEINITVADICATPLEVCEQYAARAGIKIKTLKRDILEGLPAQAFDAIFTHSFMGYFDDVNRQHLLEQWATALRKGGRLITVQRIRENYPNEIVRFDLGEIDNFVARAGQLMQLPGTGELAGFDIVAMAKKFAENFQNHPVRSAEQLQAMLESAGFKLNLFERQATIGTEGVTGPSVPNAAGFYLIVAERV